MATLPDTLTSAIEKAVETHKSELKTDAPVETTTTTTEETQTTEEEEKVEETSKTETSKTAEDEDTIQGRALVQALRDPEKAPLLIKFLAEQAGYTKTTVETKTEVKEATKDVTAIFEEALGDEFKFLAPKLGPAIKKVIESLVPERDDSDLRERLERQELKEIQAETSRVHQELAKEYFDANDMPDNVVKALSTAMDDFPPNANMTPTQYYRKIFSLVAGELGLTKKSTGAREKTDKARSDSPARNLSAQDRGITADTGKGSKKMTLEESIRAAMAEAEKNLK